MSEAANKYAQVFVDGWMEKEGENETLEDRYKRYWHDSHTYSQYVERLIRTVMKEQFGEDRPQHEEAWELILITEDRIEKLQQQLGEARELIKSYYHSVETADGKSMWDLQLKAYKFLVGE